jgi:processive 1,2-diacylglycerol beta-glucosyltransferase
VSRQSASGQAESTPRSDEPRSRAASRRAAVLSGALGSGHAVVSAVVASSLESAGWQVRTFDCMAMLGSFGAKAGDRVFRRVTATPAIYDALHFGHLRQGSGLARHIDRASTKRLLPALESELEPELPDLLVGTFATGASAAAKLTRAWCRPGTSRPRTIVLCTDVDVHWLWVAEAGEGVDLFLVTSVAARAFVLRHAPRAKVKLVPPPVRPGFYDAPEQKEARTRLGIPLEEPCVLLMGGGWGMGPIVDVASTLAASGIHVLAVAGANSKLESRLRALEGRWLRPYGFTDQVPELMAAADLVVTTPGATTCSEARVVGRPLVLLDVLPGHGRENLQHELEIGDAYACGASARELLALVEMLLSDPSRPLGNRKVPADGGEFRSALIDALGSIGLGCESPGGTST